ncbi:FAD-dependent oxidoreductase [uncultured Tenacibaculum sp.]|uniref:FAD-dependent oxidoreductase n=1 Tax=uncultured Tenacibaculum sp. TaxID=174713 RepID=UPI0026069F99|nr:FAD-dependent oxidoreductase [uncultured Tenacibaculum sp.]
MKEHLNITIVGAGVSGLVAATVLEQQGYTPTIIETTDKVGGRVKTDYIDNYQLDHGFQVLLTSYPLAKKYLDYNNLDLQKISPGAIIFNNKSMSSIGDPLRDKSFLFSTLFSSLLSFKDKLKVFKLNNTLKKKTIAKIFKDKETSTYRYLLDFGFSSKAIDNFFLPFFSGIFLENKLETSSRMFEFIYKMFGDGYAAIPKTGMQAIPNQLKNQLKKTKFIFNTKVEQINNTELHLSNGDIIKSDYTLITVNPNKILNTNTTKATKWKSCHTLYFETPSKTIHKALIGLITDKSSLINNIFYHTSLKTNKKAKNELLSVTIVKDHELNHNDLIKRITQELSEICNINHINFIKDYKIPIALPKNNLVLNSNDNIKLKNNIYLAGDYLLNGSLNAAMYSGEYAAKEMIKDLEQSPE